MLVYCKYFWDRRVMYISPMPCMEYRWIQIISVFVNTILIFLHCYVFRRFGSDLFSVRCPTCKNLDISRIFPERLKVRLKKSYRILIFAVPSSPQTKKWKQYFIVKSRVFMFVQGEGCLLTFTLYHSHPGIWYMNRVLLTHFLTCTFISMSTSISKGCHGHVCWGKTRYHGLRKWVNRFTGYIL